CENPGQSAVYCLCVAMVLITYMQICLPCILGVLMVPVLCFCLPCVIRLLNSIADHDRQKGAPRAVIERLQL
ncbi:unnamed protein product, partial [Phaeothamnion confervicola]